MISAPFAAATKAASLPPMPCAEATPTERSSIVTTRRKLRPIADGRCALLRIRTPPSNRLGMYAVLQPDLRSLLFRRRALPEVGSYRNRRCACHDGSTH